jgi:hypothetical protein
VRRQIVVAEIGLDFYDPPSHEFPGLAAHQDLA